MEKNTVRHTVTFVHVDGPDVLVARAGLNARRGVWAHGHVIQDANVHLQKCPRRTERHGGHAASLWHAFRRVEGRSTRAEQRAGVKRLVSSRELKKRVSSFDKVQKFRPLRAELVIFHLSHAPAHHTHSARLAELMRSHPHDMTRAAHPSASLFSTWNAISLLKSSAL